LWIAEIPDLVFLLFRLGQRGLLPNGDTEPPDLVLALRGQNRRKPISFEDCQFDTHVFHASAFLWLFPKDCFVYETPVTIPSTTVIIAIGPL